MWYYCFWSHPTTIYLLVGTVDGFTCIYMDLQFTQTFLHFYSRKILNFLKLAHLFIFNVAYLYVVYFIEGWSRISGLRNDINDINKRPFYKERRINKRYIHFLSKQNIKAPLILDMYDFILCRKNTSPFKRKVSIDWWW